MRCFEKINKARQMINVLITGVSSGIGEAIANSCVERGYRVFGSVRTEAQAEACTQKWGATFTALLMDVRHAQAVYENARQVEKALQGEPLQILVNNSGVVKASPLELQPGSEIREMFEVNVFGLIEVTKAFLPLMKFKKRKGETTSKIINISSTAGEIGIPFLGGYVATKHAVEGLSHAWRRELLPFGIDVVIVGPGNVITPIWDKAKQETVISESPYRNQFQNFFDYSFAQGMKGMKPEEIARVVDNIIGTSKPKVRYAPVAQKLMNWYFPKCISARALDSIMFKNMNMKKLYSE
jgi:short-subunit dehydrogenase